ncbi:TerD family protein [uncultured Selenomonas sp.]|uniref:TerD family protein n=1 Tax=uncultured Selenomonas sp. TaxID=159275 RepID=UPI0028DB86C5|nr:TerD family protein [uncultured Selenomonas sp.]
MEREQSRNGGGAGISPAALPKLLDLGRFAPEVENSFAIAAALAEETRVTAEIEGARLAPALLPADSGGFVLTLPEMREGTVVYGALVLRSAHEERRIYVAGEAQAGEPQRREKSPLPQLLRGERLTLSGGETLEFFYEDAGRAAGVDIDAYVFRLHEGARVRGDGDLVFFGNETADDGSIRVEKSAGKIGARVEVAKLAASVERVAVCLSVYEDGAGRDFSHVRDPRVILWEDGAPKYAFPLDALRCEKTVNVCEVYRYQGRWKLRLVGAGFAAGLARLCETYGLSVE